MSQIKLTLSGGTGRLEVDGVDIANMVHRGVLRFEGGALPKLTLELLAFESEASGEAKVVLAPGAEETLVGLGWTPPESASRFGFDLARRVDQDVAAALNQRATGA